MSTVGPESVHKFWFEECSPKEHFHKSETFDERVKRLFGETLELAAQGLLADWRESAIGALAEVIVLDQFSRNIHRDSPLAFAYDELALNLARKAIKKGFDTELSVIERQFLYMPYQHSEDAKVHEEAVLLFEDLGDPQTLEFEMKHKAIIDRFGRYPHRNEILGRESTPEEAAFLLQPGSSF